MKYLFSILLVNLLFTDVNAQLAPITTELYFGINYLPLKTTVNHLKDIKSDFNNNNSQYDYTIRHYLPCFEFMVGYMFLPKFQAFASVEHISPGYTATYAGSSPSPFNGKLRANYSAIPLSLSIRGTLFDIKSVVNSYAELGASYYWSRESVSDKSYINDQFYKTSYYVKGTGYGYFGAIGIQYKLVHHFSMILRAKYRYGDGFHFADKLLKVHLSKQQTTMGETGRTNPNTMFTGFCLSMGISYFINE